MANNLSASFKDVWAREQQEVFLKRNVAMEIADTGFRADMSSGDVLVRTYRSTTANDVPGAYTRGVGITIDDITDTAETLTVNKQYAFGFYVDDFDKLQNNYDAAVAYGKDKGEQLANQIDADVLGEWINAGNTVDAGTIGGTAGQGITLSTTNVLSVITGVTKKLEKANVMSLERFGVVSPEFTEIIGQYYGGKVTDLGDEVSQNGYFAKIYGYKLYSSNLTTGRAVLAMATNPSNGQTITIDGQVFTAVTTIGTTPGNFLIGVDVDTTRATLASFINAPGTTTSTCVALTGNALRKFVARASAVNDNTADTLTVTMKGVGTLTVSTNVTSAVWTTALQKQLLAFGIKGNPVLVIQSAPSIQIKDVQDKFGKNILNGCLYGLKTFADNAVKMVKVEIASSTY